jgi:hypothetical protein
MQQTDFQYLTPEEAWDDFYRVVYPAIRSGLKWHEKNRIITANRDRKGLRNRPSGGVIGLGADRIAAILNRYAPGRYGFETVSRFWIVPGVGEALLGAQNLPDGPEDAEEKGEE